MNPWKPGRSSSRVRMSWGSRVTSWHRLPTPKELEAAIERRVLDVGVAGKNIDIDDRGVLNNPIFLNATALINVRPLRTHHWSGVATCLKNYIQFVPDPPAYHDEGCSPLGKIWTYPIVKGKTRLNILSALTPQFYGRGAHFFDKRYVWPYKGLIVGTDPVAVDAIGAHLLQAKRIAFFGEDRALDVAPIHIVVADKTIPPRSQRLEPYSAHQAGLDGRGADLTVSGKSLGDGDPLPANATWGRGTSIEDVGRSAYFCFLPLSLSLPFPLSFPSPLSLPSLRS